MVTPSSNFAAATGARKMPSKSKKQARMMAAAAHNPAFAKKVGVPGGVAKEFNQADKGTSILKGKRKGKAKGKGDMAMLKNRRMG